MADADPTLGEGEAFRLGARQMQLAIAARLQAAGLSSAAAMALATDLPDPRRPLAPAPAAEVSGLEYRAG